MNDNQLLHIPESGNHNSTSRKESNVSALVKLSEERTTMYSGVWNMDEPIGCS